MSPNASRVTLQRQIGVHYAGRTAATRMSIARELNFDTRPSSWLSLHRIRYEKYVCWIQNCLGAHVEHTLPFNRLKGLNSRQGNVQV